MDEMAMFTADLERIRTAIQYKVEGDFPSLKDKIRAEKRARLERYEAFARLYELADKNGRDRAEVVRPEPMVVKDMQTGHVYPPVMDGVCGFAWVNVYPATSSFAHWARDNHGWSKGYPSGMQYWVNSYGQSYERKMAYAEGFAAVLWLAGIKASAGGRLD